MYSITYDMDVNASIRDEYIKRQSIAPDFFNSGIFWIGSLPEIAGRQGSVTNLVNLMPEDEKLCDFQVEMLRQQAIEQSKQLE